ncbi:MAG: toll/interleukin-1 receptor domain-containing protein [Verrucomicrobiales bacterium]|nr:toll/interleukin-1 receptor domain-containing protein [Verrucomicrobiales bacterium]
MNPGRIRDRPWTLFAVVGLAAFVAAYSGMGLELPPRSRGLFVVTSAVLIAGAMALIAGWNPRFRRLSRSRGLEALMAVALIFAFGLALLYRMETSLTVFPFDNSQDQHKGQPAEAFMPLWLPENLQRLVHANNGSRQQVVDRYAPGGVEAELQQHQMSLFVTTAVMALTYGMVFAGASVVGGLAARLVIGVTVAGSGGIVPAGAGTRPELAARPLTAFVSHSSLDASAAEAICSHIEDRGLRCWIAPRDIDPGADWSAQIMGAIEACPAFLVLISDNANHSNYVPCELEHAIEHRRRVLPLFLEAVQPVPSIGLSIKRLHCVHVGDPPSELALTQVVHVLNEIAAKEMKW